MDAKELEYYKQQLAPILRDKLAWDAFMLLLETEKKVLHRQLESFVDTDTLIRTNAKLQVLTKLQQARRYYEEG